MIYLSIFLVIAGMLIGLCLNYFIPDLGKTKVILITTIFVVIVGSFLFYKIYKAAHELPPGAKTIDRSEVTKDLK